MKRPHWIPFAVFGLMIVIMLVFMALSSRTLVGMYPMMSSGMGLGMWGVMILPFAVMLIMPLMMFFFFRSMSRGAGLMSVMMGSRREPQASDENRNLTALRISVPTVNCAHCKMKIEQALGNLPGVASTNVDVDAKQVAIELISPPTRAEIEVLLTDIGYPPESQ